jgi:hypothetical protein
MCVFFHAAQRYPEMDMNWPILECCMMIVFILMNVVFRILPHYVDYISFMTTKFLMSIYLLFFYFRFMVMTFPVSQTLGPALVSIIAMVSCRQPPFVAIFRNVVHDVIIVVIIIIVTVITFALNKILEKN